MGRVIKGSPASPERYTVSIPVYVPLLPAAGRDQNSAFDDPFAAFDADGEEPAMFEPGPTAYDAAAADAVDVAVAVDVEAIAAQAQELIDDAERSAETLIEDAQERARVLIAQATEQAQTLAEDARREGHDQGHAAGVEAAHEDMAEMLSTMRELLESTRGERYALLTAAEPELVRLAVGIAERVLHQQIALDHGVVVEMTKAAIARIVDREKITVRVNPADIERMREHRESLLTLGDVKSMRVIEDQRVDRGGVIIETDAGSIDAKISTQLTEVRKLLHIVDDGAAPPAGIQAGDDPAFAMRAS